MSIVSPRILALACAGALSLAVTGCMQSRHGFENSAEMRTPAGQQRLVEIVQTGSVMDQHWAAMHLIDADPDVTRPVMPRLISIYAEGCKISPDEFNPGQYTTETGGCYALENISLRFGEEAVPALESVNHYGATRALGALGFRGRGGMPTLVSALSSKHAETRRQAIEALANVGVPQERVLTALEQLEERDDEESVRAAARRARISLEAAAERDPGLAERVAQEGQAQPRQPVERVGIARPNDIAIVIGIEEYRGDVPPSTAARRDAEVFADLAESHLGLSRRNIIVLLDSEATRSSLEAYFDDWLPRNARADGRVYVYFAGHGAPDPQTGDGYLVPWDGDPRFITRQGIKIDALTEQLQQLPAQEVVLMMDSCFSGSGGRSVLAEGTRPLVPVRAIEAAEPDAGETRFSLFAAAASDEITGMTSDGAHGLFSYYLFEGIRGGADRNGDGRITLDELAAFLNGTVPDEARRENRDQTPVVHFLPASISTVDIVVFE